MAQLGFDTSGNTVAPSFGFEVFDGGKYPVIIKACAPEVSQKDTRHGMLVFELEFLDGKYKGKSYNHRCNLWHSNPETVRIAQQEVTAIAHVIGRPGAQDSDQFVGGTFQIEITRNDAAQYKNNIVGVFDMAGSAPGRAGQQPVQQAAAPPPPQQQAFVPQTAAAAPAAATWGAPPPGQQQAPPAVQQQAPPPAQQQAPAAAPAGGAPPWA